MLKERVCVVSNDRASDPTAVGAVPDLSLSKRHTAPFVDGANGVYTLVVTNVGTAPTSAVIKGPSR